MVGFPHDVFGEGILLFIYWLITTLLGIYAYVILKDGVTDSEEEIKKDLIQLVKTQIGSFAVPQHILVRERDRETERYT